MPVDGVGLECHFSTSSDIDDEDLSNYLKAISGRGYKVIISELDVNDLKESVSDIAARDEIVARIYGRIVSLALANPAVIAIITWQLSDKYSYMRDQKRGDGMTLRPLPFDREMNRKLAWRAIADAMRRGR